MSTGWRSPLGCPRTHRCRPHRRGAGRCGGGSAITDDDYCAAGAVLTSADDAWVAELVLKVKEPVAEEYRFLRANLTLFTYLHLAANEPLVDALLSSGTTAFAYETVQPVDGSLPLLAPMSEVAGRMSVLVGGYHLLGSNGGRACVLAGVPGVRPAKVTVIGAGITGSNAVMQAVGAGADVTVLDISAARLRALDGIYRGRVKTLASGALEIERAAIEADLLIGAVLIPGQKAPELVGIDLIEAMKPGSVLVDIAVDQGGCFAGTRPTTHDAPTFTIGQSIMYCVANMPGAAAATSTPALTNATLPYVSTLAAHGVHQAVANDPALARGLNTIAGTIANKAVAEAFPDLAAFDVD